MSLYGNAYLFLRQWIHIAHKCLELIFVLGQFCKLYQNICLLTNCKFTVTNSLMMMEWIFFRVVSAFMWGHSINNKQNLCTKNKLMRLLIYQGNYIRPNACRLSLMNYMIVNSTVYFILWKTIQDPCDWMLRSANHTCQSICIQVPSNHHGAKICRF